MLLIPPGMLKETVVRCRKSPEALIFLDEFFPPGLRDYLIRCWKRTGTYPSFHTAFSAPDMPPVILRSPGCRVRMTSSHSSFFS